jgi:energy-converting hydrogenase Eha subunit F
MSRTSVTRAFLLALAALALAGCVVEPGYYHRPVAYVRPVPRVVVVP